MAIIISFSTNILLKLLHFTKNLHIMEFVNSRMRLTGLTLVMLLIGSLSWHPSYAQQVKEKFFPETGHTVSGDFWRYYQSIPEAYLLFGPPITNAFQDRTSKDFVQYFERARFKLDPEAPVELRVKISPLGDLLYQPGREITAPISFPACQYFPETNKQVCYDFLDYFNAHGGVAIFGYPKSNLEFHNGRMAQYFQRSRFEWYPENPTGQQVKLANVGSEYFVVHGENPIRLRPDLDSTIFQTILQLQVNAFPERSVTSVAGEQTVYVIVLDQNSQPVANADVSLRIHLPSGQEGSYQALPTDEKGVTHYKFTFKSRLQGIAEIFATVTYPGAGEPDSLEQNAATSFRIWW
jgi:hypothetical protein